MESFMRITTAILLFPDSPLRIYRHVGNAFIFE